MGTIIEHTELSRAGWRARHSGLRLAVTAARDCLRESGHDPHEVDLLINAGIYRDRNLGEPALAAMIQEDIDANAEDPHQGSHGTFSFDIANGSAGMLTALQIADGFLSSRAIDWALVVASDADPGHGMSEHFPFSPTGAAMLCGWRDDDTGLGPVSWVARPDEGAGFNATVGLGDRRNVLRFRHSDDIDARYADAAAAAVENCLRHGGVELGDVDAIVAAPGQPGFVTELAGRLGVPLAAVLTADDDRLHTAALAAALVRGSAAAGPGGTVLLVAAAAGVTAGAALYRVPAAG